MNSFTTLSYLEWRPDLGHSDIVIWFGLIEYSQVTDACNNNCYRKLKLIFVLFKHFALFIYLFFCKLFQVVLWNTWSPIANSVLYAFPTWHTSTIALLSNWGSITFIAFIIPSCWLLNKRGNLLPIYSSFDTGGLISSLEGLLCITKKFFCCLIKKLN